MTLWEIKTALHSASGIWIVDHGTEQDIEAALRRSEIVIAEVETISGNIVVHSLLPGDFELFRTLAAWAAWTCAGRDTRFDSMFYRLDVDPVKYVREQRNYPVVQLPYLNLGGPSPGSDDEDGDNDDGEQSAPVPLRPRPRGR